MIMKMTIFDCFIFLLVQIIFLTLAKAERDVIEAKIQTDEGKVISLKWKKADSYLANENLPVWTTRVDNTIKLNPEVMKHIGNFTPYYDLEQSSAILVLEEWNCIYGIIAQRYYIRCLSLDDLSDDQPVKNTPERDFLSEGEGELCSEHLVPAYIYTTEEANTFNMLIKTLIVPDVDESDRPIDLSRTYNPARHKFEEKIIEVYPEILVIIPRTEALVRQDVVATVMENLMQFNTVAMLFAKLAPYNIKIHINIAAILIEMDGVGFSTNSLPSNNPSGQLILDNIIEDLNSLRAYNGRRVFNDDSFDFFIYTTPVEWFERESNPGGYSTPVFDIFEIKSSLSRPRYPNQRLGSIVDSTNILNFYSYAAREIAHLMTVEDDPFDHSRFGGRQCHHIMTEYTQCLNCLYWSSVSVASFKQFLSINRNRCFLRNLPRSLRPFNTPARTLYPGDQCLCYHFSLDRDITYLNSGKPDHRICKSKIHCHIPLELRPSHLPSPIDGTPCDPLNKNKVCWKNECQLIP